MDYSFIFQEYDTDDCDDWCDDLWFFTIVETTNF